MVPVEGLEPPRFWRLILSQMRLPIPPHRRGRHSSTLYGFGDLILRVFEWGILPMTYRRRQVAIFKPYFGLLCVVSALSVPTYAGVPVDSSPAIQAAQARLDAAAQELAELLAKEHPGASRPRRIELAIAADGASGGIENKALSTDLPPRRLIIMTPEEGVSGSPPQLEKRSFGQAPGAHWQHGDLLRHHPRAEGGLQLATVTAALAHYFGVTQGVLVLRAQPDSDLADGDVITTIGGRSVSSAELADRILATYDSGEPAPLTVVRDRRILSLSISAGAQKGNEDR